jgi:hypothetical protein
MRKCRLTYIDAYTPKELYPCMNLRDEGRFNHEAYLVIAIWPSIHDTRGICRRLLNWVTDCKSPMLQRQVNVINYLRYAHTHRCLQRVHVTQPVRAIIAHRKSFEPCARRRLVKFRSAHARAPVHFAVGRLTPETLEAIVGVRGEA